MSHGWSCSKTGFFGVGRCERNGKGFSFVTKDVIENCQMVQKADVDKC